MQSTQLAVLLLTLAAVSAAQKFGATVNVDVGTGLSEVNPDLNDQQVLVEFLLEILTALGQGSTKDLESALSDASGDTREALTNAAKNLLTGARRLDTIRGQSGSQGMDETRSQLVDTVTDTVQQTASDANSDLRQLTGNAASNSMNLADGVVSSLRRFGRSVESQAVRDHEDNTERAYDHVRGRSVQGQAVRDHADNTESAYRQVRGRSVEGQMARRQVQNAQDTHREVHGY